MNDEFLNERRGYIAYLRPIVIEAIKEVGMDTFKRTSLFMSNRAALKQQEEK